MTEGLGMLHRLTREQIVDLLENGHCVACYDDETTQTLMEALICGMREDREFRDYVGYRMDEWGIA